MCRSGTNAIALASPGAPAAGAASNDSSGKSSSGNSLELPISVNNYKQMASTAHSMKVLDENGRQTTMYSCVICAKLVQVSFTQSGIRFADSDGFIVLQSIIY